MTVKVILNPYAGRWKGLQLRDQAEAALKSAGIDYELAMTERPKHGLELAAQAVKEGFDAIIVAGGDGSINEVVNGLVCGSLEIGESVRTPLGILPFGTANDLVVNLGLPVDLEQAALVIAAGNRKYVDLGQVTYGNDRIVRYFSNNSAIGLEPTVTLIQQRITRVRGIIRYLLATLMGIARNPHWTVTLQWEDGEYQGLASLVTVGNNPLTGGLFYMTPHASPYDGLLTFVHAYLSSRLKILQVLPKTMKSGKGSYVEHPAIHEFNTRWLRIHTDPTTPLHTDGEILSEAVNELEYRIHAQYLPILLP